MSVPDENDLLLQGALPDDPADGCEIVALDRARLVRDPWVLASEVQEEPVEWLWEGMIPSATFGLLSGKGGLGKSTLGTDLAARVTTGRAFPGGEPRPPWGAVWISSEESAARQIVPRFLAAGGDPERFLLRREDADLWLTTKGIEELAKAVERVDARLVVLDALKDFHTGSDDREKEVRDALRPLVVFAHEHRATFLGIRHWRKGPGSADERGAGSIGYRNLARFALHLGPDPQDDSRLILAVDKSSFARKAVSRSLAVVASDYRVPGVPRVEWGGERPDVHADDLALAEPKKRRDAAVEAASAGLRRLLSEGPQGKAKAVDALVDELKVSRRSVERAAERIGVVTTKPFGSTATWELPDDDAPG